MNILTDLAIMTLFVFAETEKGIAKRLCRICGTDSGTASTALTVINILSVITTVLLTGLCVLRLIMMAVRWALN